MPIAVLLRKFKKQASNNNYKKSVQSFLDLVTRHETYIAQLRSKIKDKSIQDPARLFQQFSQLTEAETALSPLLKEQMKIEKTRSEQMNRKLAVDRTAK